MAVLLTVNKRVPPVPVFVTKIFAVELFAIEMSYCAKGQSTLPPPVKSITKTAV